MWSRNRVLAARSAAQAASSARKEWMLTPGAAGGETVGAEASALKARAICPRLRPREERDMRVAECECVGGGEATGGAAWDMWALVDTDRGALIRAAVGAVGSA